MHVNGKMSWRPTNHCSTYWYAAWNQTKSARLQEDRTGGVLTKMPAIKEKIHIIARRRASWLVGVHEVILKYLLDHYWLVSVHIQEEESGCVTITNRIAKYQVMIIDRLQNALINWPSICVDVHQHQPDTYTSLWCIRVRSMTPLICPTVLFKSQTLRTPCDHHKSTTHT